MLSNPKTQEIDHRTSKLLVGLIALSLANLTAAFASTPLTSISASYYEGGWSQAIFIGFLFAISAFLLAFNGRTRLQMVLSKIAAVAALGVAMFPCECESHTPLVPHVHSASAAVMFLILAYFCFAFFQRARSKNHAQAKFRSLLYAVCGAVILGSVVIVAIDNLTGGSISARVARLIFWCEWAGLVAFGIAWLTASRVLPVLTREDERYSPFSDRNIAAT